MQKTPSYTLIASIIVTLLCIVACSTKKNTTNTRRWHSFTARYNTLFNGTQAYESGVEEKENAHQDDFTEPLPLFLVGNKNSRESGSSDFDVAIEKAEKAIKTHSIKRRPEWNGNRKKTQKDIEWLSRKEYNPILWKAWLMLGKSQFQKGEFEEAASVFSYMSRLYATQPDIYAIARSWLAICYTELNWIYDAEDVITSLRRDSIPYKSLKTWQYALTNYYLRATYDTVAVANLYKVIKNERSSFRRARQWFIMGQLQSSLANNDASYYAYSKTLKQHPPFELEFNAKIARTEVMAQSQSKQMIKQLERMAKSERNKDYLDQVYYALGNVYLIEQDTTNAIGAYEQGNKKSTRNGIEKGVLLFKLGDIYWEKERYNDAQRCYGEAVGLLDKDRKGYTILSQRSKSLDELVPYTDAIYLQDSLQALSLLPEEELYEAIDRVIEALKKEEAEAEKAAKEAKKMGLSSANQTNRNTLNTQNNTKSATSQWYFYNAQTVAQGKIAFQNQWGKRSNTDLWRLSNRSVVASLGEDSPQKEKEEELEEAQDSLNTESIDGVTEIQQESDSTETDPHNPQYYLAQIPFTEEQKAESDNIIMDALYHSGVIFKDKLDNFPLSLKALYRLTTQYPSYENTDLALYHLFLLYSRMGKEDLALTCLTSLQERFPESEWTILLSDPYFVENSKFGIHIEDSLYAATYDAFKLGKYSTVFSNSRLSSERFPLGANRDKFIFIEALSYLNEGDAKKCLVGMKEVVEKFPESDVAVIAGMIIKGVQAGRALQGGRFDIDDIWARRGISFDTDDDANDTLSTERNTNFIFLLAYQTDSIDTNLLLFNMAKYNFTNFLVRNFDIEIDVKDGINRMLIKGFLNYDEALQYVRRLYADEQMAECLAPCRRIIVSQENFNLLGSKYSYLDYEEFFEENFAPLTISDETLLEIPDFIEQPEESQQTTVTDEEEQTEVQEEEEEDFFEMPAITPQEDTEQDLFDMDNAPQLPATADENEQQMEEIEDLLDIQNPNNEEDFENFEDFVPLENSNDSIQNTEQFDTKRDTIQYKLQDDLIQNEDQFIDELFEDSENSENSEYSTDSENRENSESSEGNEDTFEDWGDDLFFQDEVPLNNNSDSNPPTDDLLPDDFFFP